MNRGVWIVFEGPDGTGKDTLIKKIEEKLSAQGVDFVTVKDPSPDVAMPIRKILLHQEDLTEEARLFLYLAARNELLHKQIVPALEAGKIVLCNRYDLSTYAYQGEHFSYVKIRELSRMVELPYCKPDLQLVLLSEKSFRPISDDVMDKYCEERRERIVARYLGLAKEKERKIKVLQVEENGQDKLFGEAWELIRPLI